MACAACASVQAAVTGWSKSGGQVTDENGQQLVPSGSTVLYVGTTENSSGSDVNTKGIGTVSKDSNGNTVIDTVKVADYNNSLTSFRISADNKDGQVAKIGTLTANDNSSISVGISGWSPAKSFSNLTIDNLEVKNGSIIVEQGQTLTLNKLTGSLNSVSVYGSLNLSSNIIGLKNFTLDADSTIGGVYNVGIAGVDKVTFTLTDLSVVEQMLNNGNAYEKQLTGTMWNAEKIQSASLTIIGAEYGQGGLIFCDVKTGKYYESAEWYNDGKDVKYSEELTLALDTAYIVAKVDGNQIKGLHARVTVPEPTTATLSLLALAGLAMRRRRR